MASDEVIQRIKEACSIADVIGEVVPLKPSGSRFKALCPFHPEKTPSFVVNPDLGIFHCFGCNVGGDVFSFLMKHDGLSFAEALELLARKTGISLGPANSGSPEERRRATLYQIHDDAQKFFLKTLWDDHSGAKARQYLDDRKIPRGMWEAFGLGYAPAEWRSLTSFLSNAGHSKDLIVRSGLAAQKGEQVYDRFRDRIIFPITSPGGQVLAFGGRALSPQERAKYINSPSTDIYEKGRMVYGLQQARSAIVAREEVVVTEGYLDVIMCASADIRNVVSPLGTALTIEQANLLRRYAQRIIVLFDADSAGIEASLRALETCLEEGLSVRVGSLPPGKDPCDVVVEMGGKVLERCLADALGLIRLRISRQRITRDAPIEAKVEVLNDLLPVVAKVKNEVEVDAYILEMSERFGVREGVLREELAKFRKTGKVAGQGALDAPMRDGEGSACVNLLKILILFPRLREGVTRAVQGALPSEGGYGRILREAMALQERGRSWDAATLIRELPLALHPLISGLNFDQAEFPRCVAAAEEAVIKLLTLQKKKRTQRLEERIERANDEGQIGLVMSLQKELLELKREAVSFSLEDEGIRSQLN